MGIDRDRLLAAWVGTLQVMQPFLHRAMEAGVVVFVCVLTWLAFRWAMELGTLAVAEKGAVDLGVGAIIAAVLTPLSGLQGYVLAKYISAGNGAPK